jgi:mannose-6-phosphate isomerase-like protein (cupin superfamily)
MSEFEKGLNINIPEPLKSQALRAFQEQLAEWQIVMPQIEAIVLDFGINDFYNTGLIEYWVANEIEAGYCGKLLFVFDNQTCPMHKHKNKHETFYIIKGRVKMNFAGKISTMEPGAVLPVPVGELHSFTGIGPALLLEISKPCIVADNFFENKAIQSFFKNIK